MTVKNDIYELADAAIIGIREGGALIMRIAGPACGVQ